MSRRSCPNSGASTQAAVSGLSAIDRNPVGEHAAAQEEMKEFEQRGEVPSDLSEWPDGTAEFLTFGHDDEPYGEGTTAKLGGDR